MKLFVAVALCALALLAVPREGKAWLTWFDFQRVSNTSSVLTMTWEQIPGHYSTASWRAGSGTSTDACWIAHGWLPTGWYDLTGHWDYYDGSAIKGRAISRTRFLSWSEVTYSIGDLPSIRASNNAGNRAAIRASISAHRSHVTPSR